MGALKQCGRGAELDERVVAIFDSVIAAAAAGPAADKSEAVFLATAFCAAVYGADRTVVVNITLTNYPRRQLSNGEGFDQSLSPVTQ